MAKFPAPLLSALLLAALAAAASAVPMDDMQDVQAACQHVHDPKLCVPLISRYSAKSVHDLTSASIKEAMATGENAMSSAERARSEPDVPQLIKSDLAVCSKGFYEAMESLKKASADMDATVGSGYNGVVDDVTAALTFVGACNDAFSDDPGAASPVADDTMMLKNLVSNALTLSVALMIQENKGDNVVNPAPAGN